jgi:hypothetical protein
MHPNMAQAATMTEETRQGATSPQAVAKLPKCSGKVGVVSLLLNCGFDLNAVSSMYR